MDTPSKSLIFLLKLVIFKASSYLIVFTLTTSILVITLQRQFNIALTASFVTVVFFTTFAQLALSLAPNLDNEKSKKLIINFASRLFRAAIWLTIGAIFVFVDFVFITYFFKGENWLMPLEYLFILLSLPGFIFQAKSFYEALRSLEDYLF